MLPASVGFRFPNLDIIKPEDGAIIKSIIIKGKYMNPYILGPRGFGLCLYHIQNSTKEQSI